MKKKIHQIFLDVGLGKFEDNLTYVQTMVTNKKNYGHIYEFKLWNDEMVEELVKEYSKEIQDLWNNFPNKFYKVDFSRFLILYKEGGIYLDLDLLIKKDPAPIFKQNFMALWNHQANNEIGDGKVNNDVIHLLDKNDYMEFIKFIIKRSNECKMPKNWRIRRFKHIVSNHCYHMYCKYKKYNLDGYQGLVNKYFYSYWTVA